MNIGWSGQDAADELNIGVNSISNSLNPAVAKLACLWNADATKTMDMLLNMAIHLRSMPRHEAEALWKAASRRSRK